MRALAASSSALRASVSVLAPLQVFVERDVGGDIPVDADDLVGLARVLVGRADGADVPDLAVWRAAAGIRSGRLPSVATACVEIVLRAGQVVGMQRVFPVL